jgi:hypothetical protein
MIAGVKACLDIAKQPSLKVVQRLTPRFPTCELPVGST